MSVAGKKKSEWEAITLTNFGDPNRREVLRTHFSIEAALRAYKDIKKIYGQNRLTNSSSRVWQEDKEGNVINDSHNEGSHL